MPTLRLTDLLCNRPAPIAADPAIEPRPYVIDFDGRQVDDPARWIHDTFGAAVAWTRAEVLPNSGASHVFRLVGFRAIVGGSCVLFAYINDKDTGTPVSSAAMIRYWPGAGPLPAPILPPASDWHDTGIVSWTKADGSADWGMGHGDAYYPETSSGVSEVWVADLTGSSDLVKGLGWLDGTAYQRLCPVFERRTVDTDEPEPKPEDEDVVYWLSEINEQLLRIADAAESIP